MKSKNVETQNFASQRIQDRLGKTLWAIADNLRDAMNADQFRYYMFSVLVLCYLASNYGEAAKKGIRS